MFKKDKKKPQYPLLGNLVFMLQRSWQIDKRLLLATLMRIPIVTVLPLLGAFLTSFVVALVSSRSSVQTLLLYILSISASLLLLHMLNSYVSTIIEYRAYKNRFLYINMASDKAMDTDYENIEHPDGQTKMQKALGTLSSDGSGMQQIFDLLVQLGSSAIGLLTWSALIIALSPWIVVMLLALTTANYYINRANIYWTHRHKDLWVPIDRKLMYIRRKAGDFQAAKDMRLYGMSAWFKDVFAGLLADRMGWHRKSENRAMAIHSFAALATFARDGAGYGFLIYHIMNNGMTVAEFVFYAALISQYSWWLLGVFNTYNALQRTSLALSDVRDFLDMPDRFNRGAGADLPTIAPEIVFDQVSFTYPKSDNATLKNVSFAIKRGEKVALVGLNGAGKTTLVKLLCGLYHPTEGEITVAGTRITEYNRNEYYSLLSVVFQDIHLMPVSIAKNIALCEEEYIDRQRLEQVLQLSGLVEKVLSLPDQENTILLKSVHDDATELSGGEKQKLALARALYKGGHIIVLDEPTAALDPIAENEMYMRYNELTEAATSIFISHRLSSTRFCDRILMMDNGEIVEEGTHDELMMLDGKYANLFHLQSHYYKEGVGA